MLSEGVADFGPSACQGKGVRNRPGPQTRRSPRDLLTGNAKSIFCFSVVRQKGGKRIEYGIFNILQTLFVWNGGLTRVFSSLVDAAQ